MLDSLLLNPTTSQQLRAYISNPSQGLLLHGSPASGKKTIAKLLSAELLGVKLNNLSKQPYYIEVIKKTGKQTIDVETIRELRSRLNLTTTGQGWPRRIVLVSNSEQLGIEPQNMLLKLLEEPPADTVLILTSDNPLELLPTVRSRLHKIAITPIGFEAATQYYQSDFSQTEIAAAWNLSGGSAGLLHSLLNSDETSALKQSVVLAKELLVMPLFERLSYVDRLSKDNAAIDSLFEALLKVLSAAHFSTINSRRSGSDNLLKKRRAVLSLLQQRQKGANARLLLSSLMLSL